MRAVASNGENRVWHRGPQPEGSGGRQLLPQPAKPPALGRAAPVIKKGTFCQLQKSV